MMTVLQAVPADHPLAGMLDGTESVASDTMETGASR
jgi:hypothetical protein